MRELCQAVDVETGGREVHVAASQYLTRYVLIDVLRDFRTEAPDIHVRVSTMNERDIEDAVLHDADVWLGSPLRMNHPPSWTISTCSRWGGAPSVHSIIHSVRESVCVSHMSSPNG